MYYDHFRLSGEPFSLTPDPAFLFASDKHREAMAAVQYGLLNSRGFVTLIGEVGTGKTTILYSILSRLGPEVATAYVPYTAHSFDDLLRVALKDLGASPRPASTRLELLETLQALLLERDSAGQRVALVIDEAQSLGDETFEELRLLSNFETYTHKLLQIVLVGQPELQDRLHQQNLRQLRQRVSVHAVINPLDATEMRAYIAHRLRQVGGSEELFAPAALRAIVRHAQGIPRRANIVCHNALLFAFAHGLPVVTAAAAREAIAEMDERRPGFSGRRALRRLPVPGRLAWRVAAGVALALALGLALAWVFSRSPGAGAPSQGNADPVATTAPRPVAAPPPSPAVPVAPATPAVRAAPPTAIPEPTALERAPEPGAAPAPVATGAEAPATPAPTAERGEAPAAQAPAEPVEPSPAPAGAARTVQMPRGSSILSVARDLYGAYPDEHEARALLGEVQRLNPEIHDVNVVIAGEEVRFPVSIDGVEAEDGERGTP